ncbi:MAG TPA: GntR family transcriptional regulator [Stellaceae bacterium]|nr:GntR family transcriptional regulator [Stellaceae bacterium]
MPYGAVGAIAEIGPVRRGRASALADRHLPLRDIVTEQIRDAILAGRYKPGARLVEDRLASDFQVSRNPVREALRSLASEGLVAVTPRRGAAVAIFSPDEGWEMIEVRAMLEGLNARHAARRHDPTMIAVLSDVLEEGRAKAATASAEELVRLNGRFHDLLAAAGSNRILGDIMRSLRERTNLVFSPASTTAAAQNWAEHAAILEAVIAGDEDLAALHATRHVLKAGQRYAESAGSGPPDSGQERFRDRFDP